MKSCNSYHNIVVSIVRDLIKPVKKKKKQLKYFGGECMKGRFKYYKHAVRIAETSPEILKFFDKECVRINDLVSHANLGHLKQYANNHDLGFYVVMKSAEGLRIGSYFEKRVLRKLKMAYDKKGFKSKNMEVVWSSLKGLF